MLIQELKKLKLQAELVTVSRYSSDYELTGTVAFVNDNVLALCMYTDEGVYDGITLFELSQIESVVWGNREHAAIALLTQENGPKRNFSVKSETFEEMICELADHFASLCFYTVETEEEFYVAELENFSDQWLKLHTFTPKKSLSRMYKLLPLDSVIRVTVDSPYQNNLLRLHTAAL